MSAAQSSQKQPTFAITVVIAALFAAFVTQISHELTHAIAMLIAGTGVNTFQLFGVLGNPVVDTNAQLVISGSAAVVNVVIGILAGVIATSGVLRGVGALRLFVVYLAAYQLMTGFGYFFIDALLYAPDAPFFPDWQRVIHELGGGWDIRLPLLLVGTGGLLIIFFWLPPMLLRFVSDPTDKATRGREMFTLAMLPYLIVNGVLMVLAFSHPLGVQGVVTVAMQYWMGYIPLFWAYFIGGMWTDVSSSYKDASQLSTRLPAWLITGATAIGLIAIATLPGIRFI